MLPKELIDIFNNNDMGALVNAEIPETKEELISKFRALKNPDIDQVAVGMLVAAMFDILKKTDAKPEDLREMACMALRMTNRICDIAQGANNGI